jgi:hypothetical protein
MLEHDSAAYRRVRPDYGGGGLVNLMASLAAGLGGTERWPVAPALPPEQVAEARNVVLVIIDGLGWRAVAEHPDSWLARHTVAPLTSVYPSTTTSAITTLLTGVPPAVHGLPAWFTWLREWDRVAVPLMGAPRDGERTAEMALPYQQSSFTTDLDVTAHTIQPGWLMDSAYTRHHAGAAWRHGFDGLAELNERIVEIATLSSERNYLQAYWPEYDHLCHEHGTTAPETLAHFAAIDVALSELRAALPEDALLLVTADHGLVDTAPDGCHQLMDHPRMAAELRVPLCGEPRAPFLHVRPGRLAAVRDYIREHFAGVATPWTREEVLWAGWLGPGEPHPELEHRIGDLVLEMAPGQVLVGSADQRGPCLRGVHGGFSAAEMSVPLVVATGSD